MVTAEPLEPGAAALAEAKAYLRIETEAEDALVARLVLSAAELCEAFTGRALLARGFVEQVPASAAWQRLRATPVLAISAVEAVPRDGAAFALPAGDYAIDIDAAGDGWIRVTAPGAATRLGVAYRAGLAAEWSGAPEALKQGIIRLAAHLYAHRDGEGDTGPPAAVAALWRPWRRLRLR
jgi:uncharacterized phiE125 gp8 family phage protein